MKTLTLPSWIWYKDFEGLRVYKVVFIKAGIDKEERAYILAHEECHLEQAKKLGYFKWLYQYIKELIKVGYRANKFEVEAREYGELHKDKFRGK